MVVSAPRQNGTHCAWVPQRVLSLPATAAFSQFSGLAIRGSQILVSSKARLPRRAVARMLCRIWSCRGWAAAGCVAGLRMTRCVCQQRCCLVPCAERWVVFVAGLHDLL